MKLLLLAVGLFTYGTLFSQENEERLVYINRNFPAKQLTHDASIFVATPYYSGTSKEGPFHFNFKTNSSQELAGKMKNSLLEKEAIISVSVVKTQDLYTFQITSSTPPENKLWVAGLYYSIGFEKIVLNGLEIDVTNYRKTVRNR
jgi:hypothetical protein